MVFASRRLAAVAIPAQVRHDERVVLSKLRRDLAPEDVSLRKSVQKKERWSFPTRYKVYRRVRCLDRLPTKSRKEIHISPPNGLRRKVEDNSSKGWPCR